MVDGEWVVVGCSWVEIASERGEGLINWRAEGR